MFDDITKVVLLSDMDGTLLTADKRITDADRQAISRFTELGGRFTVATGRTVQSFEQYRAMIRLDWPVVMYNGAAIHDYSEGRTLYTQPLPEEAKAITSRIMELMPDLGGEVLRAEGTYVFSDTPYEQLHTKLCNIVPKYMDLDQIPEGGWLKVLFSMPPEDVPHLQRLVDQMELDTVSFVKSAEIFLEMMPLGVSKGSALRQFRKLPGWEDRSFAAIGDFDNDIEMIRAADLGACPANAEESVKAAADLVLTRTNEEGAVAELIGHIFERCGV
ncbi:MAG: HAD family hydrolase [Ruminococcus sp.]|nr:HAD family hydrolase [Ruminococcus sp.]